MEKNQTIQIRKVLRQQRLDAIMLLNTSLQKLDPNINYFTGKTIEYCTVIFTKKDTYIVVPELEYKRGEEVAKSKGFILRTITDRNFGEMLESLKIKGNIGLNFSSVSLSEFRELRGKGRKFVDIGNILIELRSQKNPEEIARIRKAAQIADEILSGLFIELRKNKKTLRFKTEADIQQYIVDEIARRRLKPSFKPIVASAKNSSAPHHDSTGKLAEGFCIIDMGVKYKGYCSDITRTIYLGKPSPEELGIYDLVLKANMECIMNAHAGKSCAELHKDALAVMGDKAKYFIHGLGHGIGIEIHEAPRVSRLSKDMLKEDMVFTIEPGIYIKGKYGVRIEDDVVLYSGSRKQVITKTTKKLQIFDF